MAAGYRWGKRKPQVSSQRVFDSDSRVSLHHPSTCGLGSRDTSPQVAGPLLLPGYPGQ